MDITSAIDRFITNKMYDYAVLINGKWGSGKTYFVTESLVPHLKESGHDVNYLSLYGVSSTEEISQMLCIQAIKDKLGKAGTLADSKGGQIVTALASAAAKIGLGKIGSDASSLEEIISKLPNYANNVIIFDDLERCCCDINEVLGYINNFVEHSSAAVILVANEEEIGKWQLERNPELQTLIAMDSRVEINQPLTTKDYFNKIVNGGQEIAKTSFAPDELELRRKLIFHSNERYRHIKEKVIGLTIDYMPDLPVVFRQLIEDKIKKRPILQGAMLNMLDRLVEIAQNNEHENLRTFQYFLEKSSVIFEVINCQYPTLHQIILEYAYQSAIWHMKGLPMPKWEEDYGNQEMDRDGRFTFNQVFGFKFIDELIKNNAIDTVYVNEVLSRYARLAEMRGQLSDDPFQFISRWNLEEDAQVKEWLDAIEANIRNGKYSTGLFSGLLRHIAELKRYNIMVDKCDSIFSAMKEYVKSADPDNLEALDRERFILDGETGDFYRAMCIQLDELIGTAKQLSEKEQFEKAIEDTDCWASNLIGASSNAGSVIGHSFVYWIEPAKILALITVSSNSELSQFRSALNCVYDRHVYYEHKNDDLEHLTVLCDGIKQMETSSWGQVKKAYQEWLLNDIRNYLTWVTPRGEN